MSKFYFDYANKSDDREILKFLKSQVMPTKIQIFLDREPSFFESIETEGFDNHVILVKEKENDRIAGIGTTSKRLFFVNEEEKPWTFGYAGGLRLSPKAQGHGLLFKGYKEMKAKHFQDSSRPIAYLSTILSENKKAIQVLTSGKAGLPFFDHLGDVDSFIFRPQKIDVNSKVKISVCTEKEVDEVVNFLNINGKKDYNYFPSIERADLMFDTGILRNFSYKNLLLARDKDDELVGTMGLWDQSRFKRWVIQKYPLSLKILRPIINLYSKFFKGIILPRESQSFDYIYLTLFYTKNFNVDISKSFLDYLYKNHKETTFTIGFIDSNPLVEVFDLQGGRKMKSKMFASIYNEDKENYLKIKKDKIPYVELGHY